MLVYIKGNFTQKLPFSYRYLAGKMWVDKINEKELDISHVGNDESLQQDFSIDLANNKWINDEQWSTNNFDKNTGKLNKEYIGMEFDDAYITDYHSKRKVLSIVTDHLDVLTVDKRAFYIMALEVARAIDGKISEDNKQTWLNPDDFEACHADTLKLSYDEANDISLEEIKTMKVVDEPYWEEQEAQKEAYEKFLDENTFGF